MKKFAFALGVTSCLVDVSLVYAKTSILEEGLVFTSIRGLKRVVPCSRSRENDSLKNLSAKTSTGQSLRSLQALYKPIDLRRKLQPLAPQRFSLWQTSRYAFQHPTVPLQRLFPRLAPLSLFEALTRPSRAASISTVFKAPTPARLPTLNFAPPQRPSLRNAMAAPTQPSPFLEKVASNLTRSLSPLSTHALAKPQAPQSLPSLREAISKFDWMLSPALPTQSEGLAASLKTASPHSLVQRTGYVSQASVSLPPAIEQVIEKFISQETSHLTPTTPQPQRSGQELSAALFMAHSPLPLGKEQNLNKDHLREERPHVIPQPLHPGVGDPHLEIPISEEALLNLLGKGRVHAPVHMDGTPVGVDTVVTKVEAHEVQAQAHAILKPLPLVADHQEPEEDVEENNEAAVVSQDVTVEDLGFYFQPPVVRVPSLTAISTAEKRAQRAVTSLLNVGRTALSSKLPVANSQDFATPTSPNAFKATKIKVMLDLAALGMNVPEMPQQVTLSVDLTSLREVPNTRELTLDFTGSEQKSALVSSTRSRLSERARPKTYTLAVTLTAPDREPQVMRISLDSRALARFATLMQPPVSPDVAALESTGTLTTRNAFQAQKHQELLHQLMTLLQSSFTSDDAHQPLLTTPTISDRLFVKKVQAPVPFTIKSPVRPLRHSSRVTIEEVSRSVSFSRGELRQPLMTAPNDSEVSPRLLVEEAHSSVPSENQTVKRSATHAPHQSPIVVNTTWEKVPPLLKTLEQSTKSMAASLVSPRLGQRMTSPSHYRLPNSLGRQKGLNSAPFPVEITHVFSLGSSLVKTLEQPLTTYLVSPRATQETVSSSQHRFFDAFKKALLRKTTALSTQIETPVLESLPEAHQLVSLQPLDVQPSHNSPSSVMSVTINLAEAFGTKVSPHAPQEVTLSVNPESLRIVRDDSLALESSDGRDKDSLLLPSGSGFQANTHQRYTFDLTLKARGFETQTVTVSLNSKDFNELSSLFAAPLSLKISEFRQGGSLVAQAGEPSSQAPQPFLGRLLTTLSRGTSSMLPTSTTLVPSRIKQTFKKLPTFLMDGFVQFQPHRASIASLLDSSTPDLSKALIMRAAEPRLRLTHQAERVAIIPTPKTYRLTSDMLRALARLRALETLRETPMAITSTASMQIRPSLWNLNQYEIVSLPKQLTSKLNTSQPPVMVDLVALGIKEPGTLSVTPDSLNKATSNKDGTYTVNVTGSLNNQQVSMPLALTPEAVQELTALTSAPLPSVSTRRALSFFSPEQRSPLTPAPVNKATFLPLPSTRLDSSFEWLGGSDNGTTSQSNSTQNDSSTKEESNLGTEALTTLTSNPPSSTQLQPLVEEETDTSFSIPPLPDSPFFSAFLARREKSNSESPVVLRSRNNPNVSTTTPVRNLLHQLHQTPISYGDVDILFAPGTLDTSALTPQRQPSLLTSTEASPTVVKPSTPPVDKSPEGSPTLVKPRTASSEKGSPSTPPSRRSPSLSPNTSAELKRAVKEYFAKHAIEMKSRASQEAIKSPSQRNFLTQETLHLVAESLEGSPTVVKPSTPLVAESLQGSPTVVKPSTPPVATSTRTSASKKKSHVLKSKVPSSPSILGDITYSSNASAQQEQKTPPSLSSKTSLSTKSPGRLPRPHSLLKASKSAANNPSSTDQENTPSNGSENDE